MSKTDEGHDQPDDSGREIERDYSSDGGSYFGGDSSFNARSSLKPSAPAPKGAFARPAAPTGGKLLFGGASPFATMPSYTPVTRSTSSSIGMDQFASSTQEMDEPAADDFSHGNSDFSHGSADADFGDSSFSTEDPFSSSSLFDSSPACEPAAKPSYEAAPKSYEPTPKSYEPAPKSSFSPAPASSYSSPASYDSPASSYSPSFEPAPAGNGHAGATSSFGSNGVTDHAFDRYIDRQPAASEPPSMARSASKTPIETRGAVQAYDAGYDQQHPEIALGFGSAATRHAPQANAEYDDDQSDADFLDGSVGGIASRSRAFLAQKAVLVSGALVGAVLLGGAIAYAYKGAGGEISGEPPIIEADSRPVKVAPEDSGGKDLPHKNKLIYDRLQGKESAGDEKIVPREEDVAAQNLPTSDDQSAAAAAPEDDEAAAASDASDQGQADAAPAQDQQVEASAGPRRVKTLVVRPDGSVVDQSAPSMTASTTSRGATPGRGAPRQQAAPISDEEAAALAPDQGAQDDVAAIPPLPASKPRSAKADTARQQQVAAAQPTNDAAPAAAQGAGGGQFVVQVAARKSQTEALAAFADMQQKYPNLLSGYRPMVQKADLGDKGTWYRLRVGPMNQRTAAAKLCDQLRTAGLNSCLVMNE